MNRRTNLAGLLFGVAVLAGCASMKETRAHVDVVQSTQAKITNVTAKRDGDRVTVKGALMPASATATRTGHVDVAFLDADKNVITSIKAAPSVRKFMRKSAKKPTFKVTATVTADVEYIRLTHHPDIFEECEN